MPLDRINDASPDPAVVSHVRAAFDRQSMMTTIGARLVLAGAGRVEIVLDRSEGILQQQGFIHGGAVGMIADSACGFAALSTMTIGSDVVTVEYKINLIRPAVGERLIARGTVRRAGRRLCVCEGLVVSIDKGRESEIALMQATMMRVEASEAATRS